MNGGEPVFPARMDAGGGLELRQLEPDDAEEIFAAVCENRERLARWLPWVESTAEPAHTRAFLEQVQANRAQGRTAAYSIRAGGELAGLAGLHDIDSGNASAQIGYWITARFEGRGIMTQAVGALLRLAFETLRLERVEIRCACGNLRSQAIPKRLGFTLEGRIRRAQRLRGDWTDFFVYGLLREEWQRLRAASAALPRP